MNSRAAAQALVPGRVIMLADKSSGLTELGVVCGSVPASKTGIQLGSSPAAGVPDDLLCQSILSIESWELPKALHITNVVPVLMGGMCLWNG